MTSKIFFFVLLASLYSCKKEYHVEPITFINDEYFFDLIKVNDSAITYFKFKTNIDNVLIKEVKTDCGCTEAKFPNTILQKNSTDSVKVVYDSSIKGHFFKRIWVYTNTSSTPIMLYIKGEVFN
jgi:hypothetical protein